jgi:hypothetical protein
MNFEIESHAIMEEDHLKIRLPRKIREDLGVLVGQFMQIKGKEALVLQVGQELDVFQEHAYVSPRNLETLKSGTVEFKILDVTLGCDPEFFILWKSTLISAATYLPFNGAIGADGSLGELRPMYARHEDGVVDNLGKLIPMIPERMTREKWASGFPYNGREFDIQAHSYHKGLAAGFHVHLGIPPEILNTRKDFSRAAMNHLVKCLDWYVSVPLVPLEVSPARRTGSTNYGKPGDYRPSNVTLEYRTPGAFYLRTPTLARGLLGLCLMVTENIVSRMKVASKGFVNLDKLGRGDLNEIMPLPSYEVIKGTLLARSPQAAKEHLEGIKSTLEELPTYGKHRRAIEDFFSVVESGSVPDPNLISNWKGRNVS